MSDIAALLDQVEAECPDTASFHLERPFHGRPPWVAWYEIGAPPVQNYGHTGGRVTLKVGTGPTAAAAITAMLRAEIRQPR